MTLGFYIGIFLLTSGLVAFMRRTKYTNPTGRSGFEYGRTNREGWGNVASGLIDTALMAFSFSYGIVLTLRHWP